MLVLVISIIDFIVTLLSSSMSKVQILKGGMCNMIKQKVEKVKSFLDNPVVKAFLLISGMWFTLPQP